VDPRVLLIVLAGLFVILLLRPRAGVLSRAFLRHARGERNGSRVV